MLDYNKWLTTPAGKKFLQEQHKTKSPSIAGESPLQLDDLLGLGVLTGGYKLGTKLLSKKVTKGFKNNYIPSRNVKGDIFDSRFRRGYEPSINPKSTIKPGTFTDESLKADEARRLWNNEYNKNHPDLEQFNLGEYKQGGLINNNTMKKKMLPKYKFGDWLSNTFDLDTQGASFGDVAADTGMFAANAAMSATPLSIIPAITGKSAASMTGYKNKTGMGENLTGTADTIYGMQAKLAPIGAGIIGNAVAPGIGGPLATAAMTGAQEGYNQIRQSQQQNQVPQMNYNSAPIMNSSPNVNNQYNPTMTKFGGYLKRYDDGGIMEYKVMKVLMAVFLLTIKVFLYQKNKRLL